MRRNFRSESGMSLVEATIILMVLAILTSVIAPSMGDYVEDARQTKAKEDVEAIGTGILRLLRDTGFPCLSTEPVATASLTTACDLASRVEVLQSGGSMPGLDVAASTVPDGTLNEAGATYNWPGSTGLVGVDGDPDTDDDTDVPLANTGTVDAHLVTNTGPLYHTSALFTSGGGPRVGIGWRGPYLTGPVGADPWGYKYQVNTAFLTVASNGTAASGEGSPASGWHRDVVVVSAGSNSEIQTPVAGTGVSASGGDDVIYVIQGATR